MPRMPILIAAGIILLLSMLLGPTPALALEIAPRISDRELIERLTKLEEGQKQLAAQIESTNRRIDAVDRSLSARIDAVDRNLSARIEDLRADINRRLDTLQWMVGLFITIAVAIFAAITRVLWLLSRAQAAQETVTASLTAEIASLKDTDLKLMDQITALIEILRPPKSAL